MNSKFLKFKRGTLLVRILKSALAAVSGGGCVCGPLLLLINLELIGLSPILLVSIGGGAAVIVGVGVFLLLLRSDARIAAELDARYSLNERVSTMLEFKDSEGAIYELQRQDTEESLGEISPRPPILSVWPFALAALIGIGLFITGLSIKPEEELPTGGGGEEKIPFALSEMQEAALTELIGYIEASDMQSPYRENVAGAVSGLLEELRLSDTVDERDEAICRAMDTIYEQTDEASLTVEITEALWQTDHKTVGLIAKAINYYSWPEDEWGRFADEMADFRILFEHPESVQENPDTDKMIAEVSELLARVGGLLPTALVRSGAPEDNAMREALILLAESDGGDSPAGLLAIAEIIKTDGYVAGQNAISSLIKEMNIKIFAAAEADRSSSSTGEYAMTRISGLFNYPAPKFKRPKLEDRATGDSSSGDTDTDGGEIGGGGIGEGAVYGSDDMVLDPMTGKYVEYGTILNKYYEIMFGKLEGGNYTDEEKDAMKKYFEILYGGFEEQDG